jgi:hypothetical protein
MGRKRTFGVKMDHCDFSRYDRRIRLPFGNEHSIHRCPVHIMRGAKNEARHISHSHGRGSVLVGDCGQTWRDLSQASAGPGAQRCLPCPTFAMAQYSEMPARRGTGHRSADRPDRLPGAAILLHDLSWRRGRPRPVFSTAKTAQTVAAQPAVIPASTDRIDPCSAGVSSDSM